MGGFLRYLGGRMIEDRCQQTAAALTWVTLFALVPLLTVFYAILSLVPGFQDLGDQLQTLVFRHFVPSTGAEIQQYLAGFAMIVVISANAVLQEEAYYSPLALGLVLLVSGGTLARAIAPDR